MRGWAIEAICEHLEAVSHGEIKRLLINVPPGFMKSLATDVFWPAWEWGPLGRPSTRYVTFSYSSMLTERDNGRFAAILASPKYRRLWGKEVPLPPIFGATKVKNLKTGWKIASSVQGMGTGERGDRVICFPFDQLVATEHGPIEIGQLVESKLDARVWSSDPKTGRTTLQPITGRHVNPGSSLVAVTLENGLTIRCTPCHRIWTTTRGWVEAARLCASDVLPSQSFFDLPDSPATDAKPLSERRARSRRQEDFKGLFCGQFRALHRTSPDVVVRGSRPIGDAGPGSTAADLLNGPSFHTITVRENVGRFGALSDHHSHLPGKFRTRPILEDRKAAVALGIVDVLRPCAVLEVIKRWVGSVAVLVAHLLASRARTDKGSSNQLVTEAVFARDAVAQGNARVSIDHGLFEDTPLDVQKMGCPRSLSRNAVDAAQVGNKVSALVTHDRKPSFTRVVSVKWCGHAEKTYCLTVARNHTFYCGDVNSVLVSNCDDPHNIKESESEAVRTETVRWFRESMSNRLNNPDKSAIIVIMQRVHEDDVSGVILSNDFGYEHLCIPQEFDWRRPATGIGWEDPREDEGELAFPERFSRASIEADKIVLGPTAYAAQHQQTPTPRGGNIIERDWWQLWPPDETQIDYQGSDYDPDQYPPMSLVVGSVDTSYGEKDENAYNAMTTWGVWEDRRERPKVMLMHAWRKRLPLRGAIPENLKTDPERRPHWGLVEHVANSVRKLGIDVLLIEDKTRGNDLRAELVRLLRPEECQIVMIQPKADKVARLHAVQPMFAAGMVWAPDKAWAQMVIDEVSQFPKSKYADLTDTASQALSYLRRNDILLLGHEADEENLRTNTFRSQRPAPYDV